MRLLAFLSFWRLQFGKRLNTLLHRCMDSTPKSILDEIIMLTQHSGLAPSATLAEYAANRGWIMSVKDTNYAYNTAGTQAGGHAQWQMINHIQWLIFRGYLEEVMLEERDASACE
jgi:hypothetical protein